MQWIKVANVAKCPVSCCVYYFSKL